MYHQIPACIRLDNKYALPCELKFHENVTKIAFTLVAWAQCPGTGMQMWMVHMDLWVLVMKNKNKSL